MTQQWKMIVTTLVVAGLSGCASMSGDECLTGDWAAIGYEDGARGFTSERLGQRRKACAKHGVTLDFAAYQNGRDLGLVEYCQPGRGFDIGNSGGRYNGVCSVEYEAEFLDAYNAGYHLHTLRSNVNRASSSISVKENELERIKDEMLHKEARLIDSESTTEQRIILIAELKDLSERTGELESQIKDLYDRRARYEVELENYQVAVANFGY